MINFLFIADRTRQAGEVWQRERPGKKAPRLRCKELKLPGAILRNEEENIDRGLYRRKHYDERKVECEKRGKKSAQYSLVINPLWAIIYTTIPGATKRHKSFLISSRDGKGW